MISINNQVRELGRRVIRSWNLRRSGDDLVTISRAEYDRLRRSGGLSMTMAVQERAFGHAAERERLKAILEARIARYEGRRDASNDTYLRMMHNGAVIALCEFLDDLVEHRTTKEPKP